MPRTLPWKTSGASAPTVSAPRSRPSVASSSSRPSKRPKVEKDDSDAESDDGSSRISRRKNSGEPSTSPPPSPPPESFMHPGLHHDDRYRMVEDELLSIAKMFTVHLHTAEYKRQEKLAQSRNAATITSISRPVVGRMGGEGKRKAEAIARMARQRSEIEKLRGGRVGGGADESDEEDERLPYVGTSIHGLMASPGGKGVSLKGVGEVGAGGAGGTRAARGFGRKEKEGGGRGSSPLRRGEVKVEMASETDEDEDDLDAPIPAPSFRSFKREISKPLTAPRNPLKTEPTIKAELSIKTEPTMKTKPSIKTEPHIKTEPPSLTQVSATRDRIARRLEQARLRKKQEEEKKSLDVVPSFL
ncbi:Transcription initiation factor IIA gamma subunit protein [Rutstroemia sp. NJR-2017a BBW]|nr:Transcription initiation factor IIA gamma subunit protein [Rutstroemia sp. NJR-2017a BBW]